MKLCTVTRGLDFQGKEHFVVSAVGQPSWPLAICGYTTGEYAKESEAEARVFADAPVMLDMLEHMVRELSNINPEFPLSPGKIAELSVLADRASSLLARHLPHETNSENDTNNPNVYLDLGFEEGSSPYSPGSRMR